MRLFRHQLRGEQRLYWRSRELAFFTFLFPIILFAAARLGLRRRRDQEGARRQGVRVPARRDPRLRRRRRPRSPGSRSCSSSAARAASSSASAGRRCRRRPTSAAVIASTVDRLRDRGGRADRARRGSLYHVPLPHQWLSLILAIAARRARVRGARDRADRRDPLGRRRLGGRERDLPADLVPGGRVLVGAVTSRTSLEAISNDPAADALHPADAQHRRCCTSRSGTTGSRSRSSPPGALGGARPRGARSSAGSRARVRRRRWAGKGLERGQAARIPRAPSRAARARDSRELRHVRRARGDRGRDPGARRRARARRSATPRSRRRPGTRSAPTPRPTSTRCASRFRRSRCRSDDFRIGELAGRLIAIAEQWARGCIAERHAEVSELVRSARSRHAPGGPRAYAAPASDARAQREARHRPAHLLRLADDLVERGREPVDVLLGE